MPLANGEEFAGYRILRLLGSGGMGEVYLAQHPRLPRRDALKILPIEMSANGEFRERFNREADLAATLYHPHIVGVHDRGEFNGQLWIAMDYIDGPDAGRLLRDRYPAGMPPQEVVEIVSAVADALDYAHDSGMLHRDVKPANILLTKPESKRRRILLADFGIARDLTDISTLTQTNVAMGTVSYAAPEQLSGSPIDGRADQYALAATAYHLLTGSPPFEHSNPAVVIARHLSGTPRLLGQVRPELSGFDPILSRAMSKEPAARFGSCSDFADALADQAGRAQTEWRDTFVAAAPPAQTWPPPETPASHWPVPAPTRQRLRAGVAVGAIIGLLLISLLVFIGFHIGKVLQSQSEPSAQTSLPSPQPCGADAALLASMTSRDKLAQLLMVGVTGADDARNVVANDHVGGILIERSTDLSMLTDNTLPELTKSGPLPLAVSVDEEGGRIDRLASLIGRAPSARSLAASSSPGQVYEQAKQRGQAMRKLGITIDFAPVADVSDQPDGTLIGDRSFSNNPDTVTVYAGAYARGLRDAGVLPVLKHFPGYGHGSGDPRTSAVLTPPLDQLEKVDLVPYRTLLAEAPVAVMVGNLEVPGLTGDLPASQSPAAISLLRTGGYGAPPFDGPVFTDDLSSTRAITDSYSVVEAVLRALQAGADTAIWVSTTEVPAVLDRLEAAVKQGELNMDAVDQKVLRIATLKGRGPQCGR